MVSEKKSRTAKEKKTSSNSKAKKQEATQDDLSTKTPDNTLAGSIPTKKAIGISIAISILSNILTDLIKPDSGWTSALHKVGELLQHLPFANFLTLAKENTTKELTVEDYNVWINTIVVVMADFQRQASELRKIRDEFDVSYEDIASLASRYIFESAGVDGRLDYFNLKPRIDSYFFHQYLQASLPPDLAKKFGKKMKI